MEILNDAYKDILRSGIANVPERCGILGKKGGQIIAYYNDNRTSVCSSHVAHEPNMVGLNAQIRQWAQKDIHFAGIIHSHPKGELTLSDEDMKYVEGIFNQYKFGDTLYFPVIIPGGIIIPYAVTKLEAGLSVVYEDLEVYI